MKSPLPSRENSSSVSGNVVQPCDVRISTIAGIRYVRPYYFEFISHAKNRWAGKTIVDMFTEEFKGRPQDCYVSTVKAGRIQVDGKVVHASYIVQSSQKISHFLHSIWIPMCPPAQPPSSPTEIGFYWTDEKIFLFLDEYTHVACLPDNVLAGSSPYMYRPLNLPEGIWYLVHSNEKKEYVFGFWKPKGQACKIYSNSVINGWHSTLEYYEGEVHDAPITNWVMQEYSITQKNLLCEKITQSSCCLESQREAALLLRQFAATDTDCKVQIVQRGSVRPLISMLQSLDSRLREMSAFALGRLAQDTHNQDGIVHSGGIAPLLKLIESKNGSLQHNAAFALYELSDNEVLF